MAVTVADLLVRFAADTRNADAGFDHMDQKIGGFQQAAGGMLGTLSSVGTVAVGAAATGLVALGGAMVATAVSGTQMAQDLEGQISGIAAVLGESATSIQPLKQAILDLGLNPNLKVGTLEAAAAMEALATNGLTMTQIIDGAAEATVLLSNATGGDFAQSADIMTDSMNLFGESAGSYADAVNGVVSVTNASKFTVNDYALALAQAGGVAASVGVEFNDFNTSITAISSLFGSGSDAGTSYKNMLSRLIPGSKEAGSAMAELGIITEDGSNKFFDAHGNLKSMADISGILHDALSGLSEQQKNQALTTIFGSDAMRAAVGLADAGAVVYTDVATAVRELGVSQEAVNAVIEGGVTQFEALQLTMGNTDALKSAATRMDNTRGAMEILGGVIETVKIQIGDAFLPVVRQLATQMAAFVTDNSGRITAFFQVFAQGVAVAASVIPNLVSGLFALIDVFGGVVQVISQYMRTGELLSAVEFGMSEQTAALVDGLSDFAATVVDVIGAIVAFVQPIAATIAQFVSWQDVMVALGVAVAAVVIPAIASFVAAMAPVVAVVASVIAAIALLRNAWASDFLGMQTIITGAVSSFIDAFGRIAAAVGAAIAVVGQYIRTGELLSAAEFGVSESVIALADTFGEFGADVYDVITTTIAVIGQYIRTGELLSAAEFGVSESLAGTIDSFTDYIATIYDVIAAVGVAVQTIITFAQTGELLSASEFTANEGIAALADTFIDFSVSVIDAMATLYQAIKPTLDRVAAAFGEMVAQFSGMGDSFSDLGAAISNVVSAILPVMAQLAAAIAGVVYVVGVVGLNLLAAVFQNLGTVVQAVVDGMTGILNGLADVIRGVVSVVSGIINGDWSQVWQGAGEILSGLNLIADSVFNTLITSTLALLATLRDTVLGTMSSLGIDTEAALQVVSIAWENTWTGAQLTFDSVWASLSASFTIAKTWLDTTFPTAMTTLAAFWDIGWLAIRVTWDTFWASLLEAWTLVQTWLVVTLPEALTGWVAAWDAGWTAISTSMSAVWVAIRAMWVSVQTWLVATLPTALATLRTTFTDSWEAIRATVVDKIGNITGAMNNIKTWLDSTLRSALDGFKTFLGGISLPDPFSALSGAISGITGAISSAQNALLSYIDWLSNLSIPNPLAGLWGGEADGKTSDGGRSSLLPATVPSVSPLPGTTNSNLDPLFDRLIAAIQNQPVMVTVNATIDGQLVDADITYDQARRVADVIQRRRIV